MSDPIHSYASNHWPSPDAHEGKVIGVIGLGLMGTALTERLLAHGCRVRVWNRTRDKAGALLARGTNEIIVLDLHETKPHPIDGKETLAD